MWDKQVDYSGSCSKYQKYRCWNIQICFTVLQSETQREVLSGRATEVQDLSHCSVSPWAAHLQRPPVQSLQHNAVQGQALQVGSSRQQRWAAYLFPHAYSAINASRIFLVRVAGMWTITARWHLARAAQSTTNKRLENSAASLFTEIIITVFFKSEIPQQPYHCAEGRCVYSWMEDACNVYESLVHE